MDYLWRNVVVHALQSHDYPYVGIALFDRRFLNAKVVRGLTFELLNDFHSALDVMPKDGTVRE